MDRDEIKSAIEAILFAWSDPLSMKDLSEVLGIGTKEIESVLAEMINEFNYGKRGIQIIKMNDYYQLSTRAEHYEYLQKLFAPKQNRGITQAALETLAIIAYKQPITKTEIEEIRGVKCDKAISTLLEKELIEEQGRLEKTGRPIIYGTTINFLKVFSISSLDDLPSVSDFNISVDSDILKDIYEK